MVAKRAGGDNPRVRVPELAVGVLIVTSCVLGALLWQRSTERGAAVLVAGRDLRRGQVLTDADLSAIVVSSKQPLLLLRASAAEQILGMRVLVDLPAGTPINPTQVSEVEPVDARHGLVGIMVTAAEAPLDLIAGDPVRIVVVDSEVDGTRRVETLGTMATVWEITDPNELDGRRSVTLRLPLDAVALPAGHEELHLVKVG